MFPGRSVQSESSGNVSHGFRFWDNCLVVFSPAGELSCGIGIVPSQSIGKINQMKFITVVAEEFSDIQQAQRLCPQVIGGEIGDPGIDEENERHFHGVKLQLE